jgi:uncharacterized protein (DUF2252 family)
MSGPRKAPPQPAADPHASPAERAALGRAARKAVPRSSHAEWEPASGREDPVTILDRDSADRLPELVPLRWERMLVSPFTFYRGAAALMAADLAGTPATGLRTQLCGDAHLSNFGGFAAPDRRLVFDVNDFDETLSGPWEWDVKRLAASFEIAARNRDFKRKQRRATAAAAVRSYREVMRELAALGNLEVWYVRLDLESLLERFGGEIGPRARGDFAAGIEKARAKDRMRAFEKLVERRDGELRFAADPPLIVPFEDMMAADRAARANEDIAGIIATYRRTLAPEYQRLLDGYRYVHGARKVVGVGSVGTRTSVALFVGRDEEDPLILQIKEAGESALAPYVGGRRPAHQGKRVVEGQRLMQSTGDILLGWMTAEALDGVERQYYVRQLWDQKASARPERMDPQRMIAYARLCGATLARAHARTGDRIAIAAYLGSGTTFDDAVARFAEAYAEQNERDYAAMRDAVAAGRLNADIG